MGRRRWCQPGPTTSSGSAWAEVRHLRDMIDVLRAELEEARRGLVAERRHARRPSRNTNAGKARETIDALRRQLEAVGRRTKRGRAGRARAVGRRGRRS